MSQRRMTLQEFSKKIGISTGTIWRAINNHPEVSPKTREKVLAQIKTLGYEPSWTARALATGRTQVLSFWVPMLNNSYSSTVLQTMWDLLRKNDYDLLVKDIDLSNDRGTDSGRRTESVSDGIVILEPSVAAAWVDEYLRGRKGLAKPVVTMGTVGLASFDEVVMELGTATTEILNSFYEKGCVNIAYVLPMRFKYRGEPKHDAYLRYTRQHQLAQNWVIVDDSSPQTMIDGINLYLDHQQCPEAIFCLNDSVAIAVQSALRRRGARIPDDVLLAGCDGILDTSYLDCPLTTISFPIREMCETAWGFLKDRLEDGDRPRQVAQIPAKVIYRASTGDAR